MTEVKAKKPPKPERYEIDGLVIEARRVEPTIFTSRHSTSVMNAETGAWDGTFREVVEHHPCETSKFEVYIDDVLRGYVIYPKGGGFSRSAWMAFSLRSNPGRGGRGLDAPSWKGVEAQFKQLQPQEPIFDPGHTHGERRFFSTREEAVRGFAAFYLAGKLPTAEEVAAETRERRATEQANAAERARQDEASRQRWAREAADRDRARDERWEREAEAYEGLQSLQSKLQGLDAAARALLNVTNFEMSALDTALGLAKRAVDAAETERQRLRDWQENQGR